MKTDEELTLEIWRLHPNGVGVVPADRRLLGEAPPGALKWCGPFNYANQAGWWLYPPFDVDVIYRPDGGEKRYARKFDTHPDCRALNPLPGFFEHHLLSDYGHGEEAVIGAMLQPHHQYRRRLRQTYAFGETEMNVMNVWTGCVFRTPPGWCLHLRSPVNLNMGQPFTVQEAMLETDWMPYDVWLNLKFFEYDRWASIRREQHYPIAQIIPVRRETFDAKWSLRDRVLGRTGEHADRAAQIFDEWNEYNQRKWMARGGEKDSATYRRERRRRGL